MEIQDCKAMRLVISSVDNLRNDDHRGICRRPFEQAMPVRCMYAWSATSGAERMPSRQIITPASSARCISLGAGIWVGIHPHKHIEVCKLEDVGDATRSASL